MGGIAMITPETRIRCRSIAAQLKAAFESFAVAERASFYALRLAMENALLKDFDADVAQQLLVDDKLSNGFPEVKAAMLSLFQ
jgi:hypothetical protein